MSHFDNNFNVIIPRFDHNINAISGISKGISQNHIKLLHASKSLEALKIDERKRYFIFQRLSVLN